MKLVNEYISQCILCSSNNLRLSTEKIECVTLLRKYFLEEDNTALAIILMKQKTEFSKFALKLDMIHKYISQDKLDFFKISENFKDHCHSITLEFNAFLDIINPQILQELLLDLRAKIKKLADENNSIAKSSEKLVQQSNDEKSLLAEGTEDKDSFTFEDYEDKILLPIKKYDALLNKLPSLNYTEKDIVEIMDLVKLNADLSIKIGFEIISDMHNTFFMALKLIHEKKIVATKEIIESMRSCLIVIVAVVRRKDVDISKYLKKAEIFSRNLTKNTREIG